MTDMGEGSGLNGDFHSVAILFHWSDDVKKTIAAIIALLFVFAYADEYAISEDSQEDSRFIQASKQVDWERTRPMQFLYFLRSHKDAVVFIEDSHRPPENWIKEEDVAQIMPLVRSEDAAAPVVSQSSSYLPSHSSTMGNEAMFLVEGFRSKKYPPTQCSVYDFKPDPVAYTKWWIELAMRSKSGYMTGVGAPQVFRNGPLLDEVIADSKPFDLPVLDEVLLKKDTIVIGATTINVLVNRITNTVEYVWSNSHRLYLRPKYVMPKAQDLYNQAHG